MRDGGKTYDAVIVGSPNVNAGYRLVNNDAYPKIAEDFQKTFDTLKKLPCDLFLGAHGDYFGLEKKYSQLERASRFAVPRSGWLQEIHRGERTGISSGAGEAEKRELDFRPLQTSAIGVVLICIQRGGWGRPKGAPSVQTWGLRRHSTPATLCRPMQITATPSNPIAISDHEAGSGTGVIEP